LIQIHEVEKVQISLIRQASIAKRATRMRSLSETTIKLSRRAIARTNPGLTELELNLIFIATHYGKDLADRLKEYLMERKA
jgi:hypothetical protein